MSVHRRDETDTEAADRREGSVCVGSVSVGGDKVKCEWAGGRRRREMKTEDQSNEVHTFCM